MRNIDLTKGRHAVVDDIDFEFLSKFKWHLGGREGNYYAVRHMQKNNKVTRIYMHRLIMNTPAHLETDHINGNNLDNRRANLRVCTPSENQLNRHNLSTNTTGFRGVVWNKRAGKWQAQKKIHGKLYYLGLHIQVEDAVRAYSNFVAV